jgi:hypothetical protein
VRSAEFCAGGAVFVPAPPEQKLAVLTPPGGSSPVSAVFRSGTKWNGAAARSRQV